jgi:hypothetical protein
LRADLLAENDRLRWDQQQPNSPQARETEFYPGLIRTYIREKLGPLPWVRRLFPGTVLAVNTAERTCTFAFAERETPLPGVAYYEGTPQIGGQYVMRWPARLPDDPTISAEPRLYGRPWIKVEGGAWLYYQAGSSVYRVSWPPPAMGATASVTPEWMATDDAAASRTFIGVDGLGTIWFSRRNERVVAYQPYTTTPSQQYSLPGAAVGSGDQVDAIAVNATAGASGVLVQAIRIAAELTMRYRVSVTWVTPLWLSNHETGIFPNDPRDYYYIGQSPNLNVPFHGVPEDFPSHTDFFRKALRLQDGASVGEGPDYIQKQADYYTLGAGGGWQLRFSRSIEGVPLYTPTFYIMNSPVYQRYEVGVTDEETMEPGDVARYYMSFPLIGALEHHEYSIDYNMARLMRGTTGVGSIPFGYTGVTQIRMYDRARHHAVYGARLPRHGYLWSDPESNQEIIGVGAIRYPSPQTWRGAFKARYAGVLEGAAVYYAAEEWERIAPTPLAIFGQVDREVSADTHADELWALAAGGVASTPRVIGKWDHARLARFGYATTQYDGAPPPVAEPTYWTNLTGSFARLPGTNLRWILAQDPTATHLILVGQAWQYSTDAGQTWLPWPWGRVLPPVPGGAAPDANIPAFIVTEGA